MLTRKHRFSSSLEGGRPGNLFRSLTSGNKTRAQCRVCKRLPRPLWDALLPSEKGNVVGEAGHPTVSCCPLGGMCPPLASPSSGVCHALEHIPSVLRRATVSFVWHGLWAQLVKKLPANAGDEGPVFGSGSLPREGNGNLL